MAADDFPAGIAVGVRAFSRQDQPHGTLTESSKPQRQNSRRFVLKVRFAFCLTEKTIKRYKGERFVIKFILSSAVGIFLFFAPVFGGNVPLVALVDFLKKLLGAACINYLVLLFCLSLIVTVFLGKVMKIKVFAEYHKEDGLGKIFFYVLAVIFTVMVITGRGPAQILDPNIGGLALPLAGSVMLTVTFAGWFVVMILKSGIVEFMGILIEPMMRPCFTLPGCAAVNGIASFVSAPAVGVFMTEQLYRGRDYTDREGLTVLTCFSVCSLGFFGVLVSLGGIEHLYAQVVITSFVLTFVIAAICARIPPLSGKRDHYIDGTEQTAQDRVPRKIDHRFRAAVQAGIARSKELDFKVFMATLWSAITFTQKIVAYVVSVAIVALLLAEHTPLFTWLGMPIIPVLKLLQIPNAAEIAPATLVGIAEIALPVIMISGKGIAEESIFFITVLSSVQIIFFTESANAMLESIIPVTVLDLIICFLVRTVIAIPLLALVCHFLF